MEIILKDIKLNNLRNINMEVKCNEISAIIGKNNSNKEELINLICNKEKQIEGTVEYKDCVNEKIYHLTENYNGMLFNVNIKEDIKFYLGNYDKIELLDYLKNFNLNEVILKKNYLELSSSEIKKILLIIGFMSQSKILILENPTCKLDNRGIQTLIKKLKQKKRENKIILITSYDTNFLLEISDKAFVVDDNRIIKEGKKYDIFSNKTLLKKINLEMPNTLQFVDAVKIIKNVKLSNRDNINDLIKDIYRNVK